jgi:hypothetical protein
MAKFTEGRKPQTKRIRFSHLTAFFNFMRNNFDCDFKNPCDSPMLRKLFVSFRQACVAKNILTYRDRLGTGHGAGNGPKAQNYFT